MRKRSERRRLLPAVLLSLALTLSSAGAVTIYGYQEGLAKAEEGGLWGFANAAGELVVPIQYQSVLDFDLGTALVQTGGRLGLIRPDGTYLLEPVYDTLKALRAGLYLAQRGADWGVVSMLPFPDGEGGATQELFPLQYDAVRTGEMDGLEVLILTQDGAETVVPLGDLPALLVEKEVPSAQFPLGTGRRAGFSDVGGRDWCSLWVDIAHDLGLMEGVGEGRFAPGQTLTVAEVLKLAAFLESQATGDTFHLQPLTGEPWYRSSVAYCEASGLIAPGAFDDLQRPVARWEVAQIFAATTLARSLPEINDLGRVRASVPDVGPGDPAAEAIYALYAKGILTGTGGDLAFAPEAQLTRAEAAAMAVRLARAEQRVDLW